MDFFKRSLAPLGMLAIAALLLLVWFRDIHSSPIPATGYYPTTLFQGVKTVLIVTCVDRLKTPDFLSEDNISALTKKTIAEAAKRVGASQLEDSTFIINTKCKRDYRLPKEATDADTLTVFVNVDFTWAPGSDWAMFQLYMYRPAAVDTFVREERQVPLPGASPLISLEWDGVRATNVISNFLSGSLDKLLVNSFINPADEGADFS